MYSDLKRAEVITRLAANGHDYQKTAAETGVGRSTLQRWAKTCPRNGQKKGVSELLEAAIEHLLSTIPQDLNGKEWAIAVGILFDKWLIMQGLPTARVEQILQQLGGMGDLDVNSVLAEAEAILREAGSGGAGSRYGPEDSEPALMEPAGRAAS